MYKVRVTQYLHILLPGGLIVNDFGVRNFLLKAVFPNGVSFGVRASIYDFLGETNESIVCACTHTCLSLVVEYFTFVFHICFPLTLYPVYKSKLFWVKNYKIKYFVYCCIWLLNQYIQYLCLLSILWELPLEILILVLSYKITLWS